MTLKTHIAQFGKAIEEAETILVLQPEKPDTDSMTSALALEQILGDRGKEVVLYCKDDIPNYLAYFEGADRVTDHFPAKYDAAVLVDTGGPQMVSRTLENHQPKLVKKPFFIIDHHGSRTAMPFATIDVIDTAATSTCEVVIGICRQLAWPINKDAANLLVPGILADTRNLSIPTTTPENFEIVADMMRQGADIYEIHRAYREADALSPELLKFKGELLTRMELYCGGKIGVVAVTPAELRQWAEIHDPSDLVIYDMQWAKGVEIGVVIRSYGGESKKIKVSTRANIPVAAKTCAAFGGGGHDRAAGCQFNDRPVDEVKAEFIKLLCQNIKQYESDQALQHVNAA